MDDAIKKINDKWLNRDLEKINQMKKEQSKRNLKNHNSIACMHVNKGEWVGRQFKAIRG